MNPLSPDFRTVSYAHCFLMQDVWILGKLTRSLAEIWRVLGGFARRMCNARDYHRARPRRLSHLYK